MKKTLRFLTAAAMVGITAQAQTTLTAWSFDNLATGANSSPQPSTGFGSAGALGLGSSYNNTNSVSNTNINTVIGSYVILTNNGATGWNNQITADLTGISGADNNPSFAVRIVNASSGTNCVDTTGAIYNNASGSWTFDNVIIQGTSF